MVILITLFMEFKEQKQYQEIKAICKILSNNFNIFLLKQVEIFRSG